MHFYTHFTHIPIGPCTTHPYMLLFPRDSGVNTLPLYTMRGHSHLEFMGCTMVLLSLEPERLLPIGPHDKKNTILVGWIGVTASYMR